MKGKVSLKKEITDILDNGKLVENRKSGHTQVSETDMYVTHRGKSQIAVSLSDAKAQGYSPCSRCNPPR